MGGAGETVWVTGSSFLTNNRKEGVPGAHSPEERTGVETGLRQG